jgi:hypothetical protein
MGSAAGKAVQGRRLAEMNLALNTKLRFYRVITDKRNHPPHGIQIWTQISRLVIHVSQSCEAL